MSDKQEKVPFRCKLGFHSWGKWDDAKPFGTSYIYQHRRCVFCNKLGERAAGHLLRDLDSYEKI